ncbi:hypothetical protein DMO17_18550 [Aquipseudomonas alcaligenes]|uniref:N-acetyltransferase domain-containing protein n=1 Tax=Aquipseudomonas alcaligenes TaxID=43263 RepID=A0A2V4KIY8_AQUAC|nr:GNAT family N-acetyltransferase [Pseudomonas alcaligenes]PYC20198.1 hypothetical protein DMO17_18550 [Pseudomonas alcaligenes]
MSDQVLSTERLWVRRVIRSDVEWFYRVYSQPEVTRWAGDGKPLTWDDCARWVDVTLENYAKYGYGMFCVLEQELDQVVGFCGLVHPEPGALPELKYAFAPEYWGRGYASELVPKFLSALVREFSLQKLIATVAVENKASQRVLAKSGMINVSSRAEGDSLTLVFERSCTFD